MIETLVQSEAVQGPTSDAGYARASPLPQSPVADRASARVRTRGGFDLIGLGAAARLKRPSSKILLQKATSRAGRTILRPTGEKIELSAADFS
jgi:hypothetical protein